jgi:hypothetical protein
MRRLGVAGNKPTQEGKIKNDKAHTHRVYLFVFLRGWLGNESR